MNDLFGNPIEEGIAPTPSKRKPTKKNGYAGIPGTGPVGETCKTCHHLCRIRYAKTYLKCALMRRVWTGGAGTDIKARTPACSKWEPAQET